MQKTKSGNILGIFTIAIILVSCFGMQIQAFGATAGQLQSTTITGSDLQNNPVVAKILSEIEYSKKQIAELQKNQKDQETNQKLIAQQRLIAKQLEEQAYSILQMQTSQNSSDNAYSRFLNTVTSNDTKSIFRDEFAFTNHRIDAGHIAMKKVLANGGTWEDAISEFSKYAAIRHDEMVSLNQELNDKYLNRTGIDVNGTVQTIPFDKYGRVPDDYIKVPSTVLNHGNT